MTGTGASNVECDDIVSSGKAKQRLSATCLEVINQPIFLINTINTVKVLLEHVLQVQRPVLVGSLFVFEN